MVLNPGSTSVSSTHPEGVKICSDELERVLRGNSKMVQRRRLRREGGQLSPMKGYLSEGTFARKARV